MIDVILKGSAMEVIMKITASNEREMFFFDVLRSLQCLVSYSEEQA